MTTIKGSHGHYGGAKHVHRRKSKREIAAGIQLAAVILGMFAWVVSAHWIASEYNADTDGSGLLFAWMALWIVGLWFTIALIFWAVDERRKSYAKRLNQRIMKRL